MNRLKVSMNRNPYQTLSQLDFGRVPPVDQWHPPMSGDMDLRIARDGTWHHEGRLIERERLVRLFATILRRDPDGQYYLVTPVEKWRIEVEDVPFRAVRMEVEGSGPEQRLDFLTSLGERTAAGAEHPIEIVDAAINPAPYVHVRGRLWARLDRSVYYELAERVVEGESAGQTVYGVWSRGVFFPLGPVVSSPSSP